MNNMESFDGQVVLITGASSGIGAATARRFASAGATVVLAARTEATLETVASECEAMGGTALTVPTDVVSHTAVDALIDATIERFNQLDICIVNAGTGESADTALPEIPIEQFKQVTETNVHGAFYTTRAAIPHLRETNGSLIFIGSFKGKYPSTSTPIYAASKWWLRGFAASVAGRVGPDGVATTLINPSGVTTNFGSQFRERSNNETLDSDTTLDVTDVVDAILFAARQGAPAAVTELDLNREDIFDRF
jgi:NADP-dependent 3-hydroxy acid dehydrogenase YdfG